MRARVIPRVKVWRSLSWVDERNSCRINVPVDIIRHIPWMRRVKRALIWAEELPDRAVIHVELFKPPHIVQDRVSVMIPKLLFEFGYRLRKDNVIRAFSKVFKLDERDLSIINDAYDELKEVSRCRHSMYLSPLTA